MKKLTFFALSVAMLLSPQITRAQEYQNISAFDFLLEYEDMIGQPVQIDDCVATAVSTMIFLCTVSSEGFMPAGTINVALERLPKRQLAHGLKKCSGFMNKADNCAVTIRGVAAEDMMGSASIKAQQLEWHAEK